MIKQKHNMGNKLRSFFYLFILLIFVWFAFTSSFDIQEVITGILVSLVLSLFLSKTFNELGFPPFSIKRGFFFLTYFIVLLWEIIKANFDVAYRIIHPKMPIKPGIVIIKTKLKSNIAKLALANSITLTPGTFTLDIRDDQLLIHWINVKTTDIEEDTKIIGEKFEKYLRIIFE